MASLQSADLGGWKFTLSEFKGALQKQVVGQS